MIVGCSFLIKLFINIPKHPVISRFITHSLFLKLCFVLAQVICPKSFQHFCLFWCQHKARMSAVSFKIRYMLLQGLRIQKRRILSKDLAVFLYKSMYHRIRLFGITIIQIY